MNLRSLSPEKARYLRLLQRLEVELPADMAGLTTPLQDNKPHNPKDAAHPQVTAMSLHDFPMDQIRYIRLLNQLDVKLLGHVAELVTAIRDNEPRCTKEAISSQIKILTALVEQLPSHPAQTEFGLQIREAIWEYCAQIAQIVGGRKPNGEPSLGLQ